MSETLDGLALCTAEKIVIIWSYDDIKTLPRCAHQCFRITKQLDTDLQAMLFVWSRIVRVIVDQKHSSTFIRYDNMTPCDIQSVLYDDIGSDFSLPKE